MIHNSYTDMYIAMDSHHPSKHIRCVIAPGTVSFIVSRSFSSTQGNEQVACNSVCSYFMYDLFWRN